MYQQKSPEKQYRSHSKNRNQNHNHNRRSQSRQRDTNKNEFYERIQSHETQGKKLQMIFREFNEHQVVDMLKNIILIKAIEYVPLQLNLLSHILAFLERFVQSRSSEIKKIVQIILQSDLFKNLLYQMCLTIYDQTELIDQQKIVDLFKDLHSIFQLCNSIADLRFSPIIYPIELTELVDQDYPKSKLAMMFDRYHQLKDGLKSILLSNDYLQCPVGPIMLELDFKQQIIGNLEKTNYLNYHYFILREDYLREFRQFIYNFKTKNTSKSDTQFPLYQEAQLIDFELSKKDLIWTIKMKQYDMDGRRRQVWDWKKSKRLTNGALLAFTNVEGYPIVFGVILKRDTYQPSYRSKFEIKLSIKLLSRDIQQFLDLFKCTNIVIENPIIYEASISYLLSLKTLKLPFSDVIVNGSKKVNYPKYILNFTYQIYLQTTNDNYNQFLKKSLQDSLWKCQGSLDQSQINALKLMLSAEIALIQGPPGTGKTFCGALAVRNLLANVKLQQLPILVVCYTNHALDQFLNHIIQYVDHQDVLRLGFGCKDPKIMPFMLTTQKTKVKFEWDQFNIVKNSIENLLDKILGKRYVVQKEDIQNHWPELYDKILRNEYASHIKDEIVIFDCWIQCKIPPNSSSYIQFYGEKSYLSQVKQIYRQQTFSELNEAEYIDDQEADEYFDSDEEEVSRYFTDNYFSKPQQNKQRDPDINYMETFVNKRIPYDYKGIVELQNKKFNPWLLNKSDIKGILDYIAHLKLLQDIQEYSSLFQSFEAMSTKLKLLYQDANYEYFNKKKIIGVTITGAAKYTETLKKLDTKILIIEEAAEVLESHLISILTPNIQHLILIGDHQQLKPKLSCYELEQKYGANTSLFQKLFEQGIQNVTLTCQRRMKSKFADFIRLIYGNSYQDNIPHQQENQIIDGMNSDLIYFNHSWLEERDAQTTSTQNKKEANMIIGLVIYLIGCKHKPETITVLSLYLKQATSIKKMLVSKNLKNVKVQTVDNYQGEENEIVILSLVRSNNQGSIGFVKLDNRINVALSRARVALYVFGNFKCIRQNSSPQHLWSRILALAEQKSVLKDHLELCCLRHRNVRLARTPEEIRKLSPGCCEKICNAPYPSCNHRCLKTCHFGDHLAAECAQNCERKLNCGHQCQAKCNQQCSLFQCSENVKKVLPCKHQVYVECSKQKNNTICQESITQRFPCGHSIICKCADKDKYVKCQAKCEKQLHCGHPSNCKLPCYQTCSPCDLIITKTLSCGHQHQFKCSQLKNGIPPFVLCQQPCIKKRVCGHNNPCLRICSEKCSPCQDFCEKKRDCGHKQPCQKPCSHNSTCSPCENECTKKRLCGHIFKCSNKCYQECTQCQQPIYKELSCGHTIIQKCFKSVSSGICEQNCLKVRSCGHRCQQPCHKSCQPCDTMVPKQLQCGHQVKIQCCKANEPYIQDCKKPCKKQLTCGHANKCTQLCSQSCDPCRIMVTKSLPCGHSMQLMCFQSVSSVICDQNCLKVRSCGHRCLRPCYKSCQPCDTMVPKQLKCGHQVEVQCCKVNEPYRQACMKTCDKQLQCGHSKQCTQPCSQPCDPCRVVEQQILPCGHEIDLECQQLIQWQSTQCQLPVNRLLPCGHTLRMMCYGLAYQVICEQICMKVRSCGHVNQEPCYHPCYQPCSPCSTMVPKQLQCGHQVDVQCCKINEPYQRACMSSCKKQLTCGHPNECTQLCSQPCDPCRVMVQKFLLCGHTLQVMCHNYAKPIICQQNCIKEKVCGHICSLPCHQPCPPCSNLIRKPLECGHAIDVQCSKINERVVCVKTCQKQLSCGHPNQCTQPCSKPCDPCQVMVQKVLICGHTLQVKCHNQANPLICEQNCLKEKPCGHCCSHPCHLPCPPCQKMVSKQLQCGHTVFVFCCKINEPYMKVCMKPCQKNLNCGHVSKCKQPCSRPCDPCSEMTQKVLPCGHVIDVQCFRKTQDLKCPKPCAKTVCSTCNSPLICNKLCGEPCPPCQNKQLKQLPCGHSKTVICGDKTALCFVIIQKQKDCGEHFENVPCNQRIFSQKKCQEHK